MTHFFIYQCYSSLFFNKIWSVSPYFTTEMIKFNFMVQCWYETESNLMKLGNLELYERHLAMHFFAK